MSMTHENREKLRQGKTTYMQNLILNAHCHNRKAFKYGDPIAYVHRVMKTKRQCFPRGKAFRRLHKDYLLKEMLKAMTEAAKQM